VVRHSVPSIILTTAPVVSLARCRHRSAMSNSLKAIVAETKDRENSETAAKPPHSYRRTGK